MTIPVKQLEAFYGGKFCVVKSIMGKKERASWHHLDDNDKNDDFANIVPIVWDINNAIKEIHKQAKIGVQFVQMPYPELGPDYLQSVAIIHFAEWNLARAYGCARLASFIARKYLNWPVEVRLEYALQALFYARHLRTFHLLYDTYKRDLIPDLRLLDSIPPVMAAAFFNEIGDTYSDNGEASIACRMYEITLGFGKAAQQSNFRPFRFASRLRKSAAAHGVTEQSLRTTQKQLEQSINEAPCNENQRVIVANALATVFLHHGYDTAARDVLEPLVQGYERKLVDGDGNVMPRSAATQAVVDLFQLHAATIARTESKKQPKVLRALQMAEYLRKKTGVWPTVPAECFWSRLAEIFIKHGVDPKQIHFEPLPQGLRNQMNLAVEIARKLL